MKTNWFDKKVLVLGLSKSGIAAGRYLNKKGAEVFITEFRDPKSEDEEIIKELSALGIKIEMGVHSDEFIDGAYLAITSPGIPPSAPIFGRLKAAKIRVISEIELAYLEATKPFIAITGTNGKTTTTALTAYILGQEFKAFACGNIGSPPCDLIDEDLDYFVCELSSYQIATTNVFQAQIACWLNFTPDHIDWHGGLQEYFDAKAKLFIEPYTPAYAIFNARDERLFEFAKTSKSEVFVFDLETYDNCCYIKDGAIYFKRNLIEEKIIELKDCSLVGQHNYQNIMCAVIVAKLTGIENEKIAQGIMSFTSVEHRLELVEKPMPQRLNAFMPLFYNDSKATNPEAAIVAIKSFNTENNPQKVVLIAGGRDKNTDLTEFCAVVNNHIKTVVLIGEAAERFRENLIKNGFSDIILADSMQDAVDKSVDLKPDVVLLSPACASFDMFKSYEDRGVVFKQYVQSKI